MLNIGLTGPIASGKTTVSKFFKKFGVEIISADDINRKLIAKGQPAYLKMLSHFGESIIHADGELNKKKIRTLISQNLHYKEWLERLLHPLIQQQIRISIDNATGLYCLIEIPLLTSLKKYPYINRVLLVQTSRSEQIKRLMKRDSCSKIAAINMIKLQENYSCYRHIADDILNTNCTLEHLEKHVQRLHQRYLQLF